jgi:hypothetical protein
MFALLCFKSKSRLAAENVGAPLGLTVRLTLQAAAEEVIE